MNPSITIAAAVSLVSGRNLRCLCTYCLEDLDPGQNSPVVHRAPDNSECEVCADPVRWKMGGFVFALLPEAT